MPQMWTEEEKARLRDIDSKIADRPQLQLNNRELQQAINDTFLLWQKTDTDEDGGGLKTHLNTLLSLQLIRARGGISD